MSNSTFNPRSLGALTTYVDNNPRNIVSTRSPGTQDKAPIGQVWINSAIDTAYTLTSITSGQFNWTAQGGTGGGTFSSVTITGGAGTVLDVQEGNVHIANGNLSITGNTTLNGDLALTGDFTITGDFDVLNTGSISLTSTNNAVRAIYLHANGGTAETIQIRSEQGTSANSVNLLSDDGGITFSAASGSVSTVADRVSIVSTDDSADSIDIFASDAAGGITLTAGTNGIILDADGEVAVTPATATVASPATSATINARVGRATFTGFTTAQNASATLTISNTNVTTTSCVLLNIASLNVSTNGALLRLSGFILSANTITLTFFNNGAGALGAGDNILVSFWVLS